MGATLSTFEGFMKDRYAKAIHNQVVTETEILNKLKASKSPVEPGGRTAVIALKLGRNHSHSALPEDGEWRPPGQTRGGQARIGLTSQFTSGSVTIELDYQTKEGAQAFAQALQTELEGVKEAHVHALERQVHLSQNGAIAEVASFTGAGPTWTLTLTDGQALRAEWVEEGESFNLATLSASGTATVKNAGAVLVVNSVDEDAKTVNVSQVSGTSTPAAGDRLVIVGSANNCLAGLEQIVSNNTSVFQDIDPVTEPRWRSNKVAVNGAWTFDAYKRLTSRITAKSGVNLPTDRLAITSAGIERAAYNELQGQIRYQTADNLKTGDGVVLPDGSTLMSNVKAKKGTLRIINLKDVFTVGEKEGKFIDDDGSVFRRFVRTSGREFTYRQIIQIATNRRNSSGELTGITDTDSY
jgi:hypothetical protein